MICVTGKSVQNLVGRLYMYRHNQSVNQTVGVLVQLLSVYRQVRRSLLISQVYRHEFLSSYNSRHISTIIVSQFGVDCRCISTVIIQFVVYIAGILVQLVIRFVRRYISTRACLFSSSTVPAIGSFRWQYNTSNGVIFYRQINTESYQQIISILA